MEELKEGSIVRYISDNIIIEGILEYDDIFRGGKKVVSDDSVVSYDLIKDFLV